MIFALYKIAIYGCFPIAMLVYQGILPSQKFGVTLSPEIDDNRVVQSWGTGRTTAFWELRKLLNFAMDRILICHEFEFNTITTSSSIWRSKAYRLPGVFLQGMIPVISSNHPSNPIPIHSLRKTHQSPSLPVSQSPSLPVTADHPCVANGWPNTLHKKMCPEIRWVNEWYEITILLTSSWEDVGKFNNAQPLEFFSRKMGFDYINHHSFPAISCQFWCIVFRQSHIDCWVYTGYIPIEIHYIIPMTYQYRLLGMYVYIYIKYINISHYVPHHIILQSIRTHIPIKKKTF